MCCIPNIVCPSGGPLTLNKTNIIPSRTNPVRVVYLYLPSSSLLHPSILSLPHSTSCFDLTYTYASLFQRPPRSMYRHPNSLSLRILVHTNVVPVFRKLSSSSSPLVVLVRDRMHFIYLRVHSAWSIIYFPVVFRSKESLCDGLSSHQEYIYSGARVVMKKVGVGGWVSYDQ